MLFDMGVRLQLLVGPTIPLPAPSSIMDAFVRAEVRNGERERDVFQLAFTLGKDATGEYGLVRDGMLDSPNRLIILVSFGLLPEVLIDGIITNQEVNPGREPGRSMLIVTGEDISARLDQEEKRRTFPNQSDSAIVSRILTDYAQYGIIPDVTPTTDVPAEVDRVPSQRGITDLAFIRELAERNSFVFHIEPTAPQVNAAHWGPENRLGLAQPALNHDMAADTNLDDIGFGFDAWRAAEPRVSIMEPFTRSSIDIPAPSSLLPSLSAQSAAPLRSTLPEGTANLSPIQAALRALSAASESADAATGRGVVDAARYGRALRARRLVCVRGAGRTQDGTYYVKQVTHRIERGSYKQYFTLTREGRGAAAPLCQP